MAVAPDAKLAALLADHERRIRGIEVGSQLGRSSLNVNGQELTVGQIAQTAILADTAAGVAIKNAADALAKADGQVNSFFTDGNTPPENPGVGDYWYRRDLRQSFIWSGTAWEPVTDPVAAAALADAAKAQSAADGKITTWFTLQAPANPGVGDIWWKPPGNEPRRWSGTVWELVRDGKIQDALDRADDAAEAAAGAAQAALVAQNTASGRNKVVYSTSAPNVNGVSPGDTWFRTNSGGTVLGQWNWTGTAWAAITPQEVTIASLNAGKITSGTLAVGVEIRTGTGGTYTSLSDDGLIAYVNYNERLRLSGGTSTMVADIFRSANYVNGGTSYVQIGDVGNSDGVDGIKFIRPAGSQVTLKNISSQSGGILEMSFRNNSNVNQGGWRFDSSGITSMSSLWSIEAGGGSYISGGQANLSLNGGGYWAYFQNTYGLQVVTYNGSTLALDNSFDGGQNPRVGRYNGANMKFVGNEALQARLANDSGYAYVRGLLQDQSSPDLKEDIVPLNVDALELLAGMNFYTWNWKDEVPAGAHPPLVAAENPAPSVPKRGGAGLLLSEMPWVVQPDPDATGYNTGSMIGLLVKAVQQLTARLDAQEATP